MPNGLSDLDSLKYRVRNRTDTYAPMKARTLPTSTGPRMPFPIGPNRSFTFSMPARRMTGADSRNEKRTASSRLSPRPMPNTVTMPSRLMPGSSARICPAPMKAARLKLIVDSRWSASTAGSASTGSGSRGPRRDPRWSHTSVASPPWPGPACCPYLGS
jgi:hypothetical protein